MNCQGPTPTLIPHRLRTNPSGGWSLFFAWPTNGSRKFSLGCSPGPTGLLWKNKHCQKLSESVKGKAQTPLKSIIVVSKDINLNSKFWIEYQQENISSIKSRICAERWNQILDERCWSPNVSGKYKHQIFIMCQMTVQARFIKKINPANFQTVKETSSMTNFCSKPQSK